MHPLTRKCLLSFFGWGLGENKNTVNARQPHPSYPAAAAAIHTWMHSCTRRCRHVHTTPNAHRVISRAYPMLVSCEFTISLLAGDAQHRRFVSHRPFGRTLFSANRIYGFGHVPRRGGGGGQIGELGCSGCCVRAVRESASREGCRVQTTPHSSTSTFVPYLMWLIRKVSSPFPFLPFSFS